MGQRNRVRFAGEVSSEPVFREGNGDVDASLVFYVTSVTEKDGKDLKSRQDIQLWGAAAEERQGLAKGDLVLVEGRVKTFKGSDGESRLVIAVEGEDAHVDLDPEQDVNEVDLDGVVTFSRYFAPRGDKQAFVLATLHVVTEVDGHDTDAYVPIRLFGRQAEEVGELVDKKEGVGLALSGAIVKHEKREDEFRAVVIVDDAAGTVEVTDRGKAREGGHSSGNRGRSSESRGDRSSGGHSSGNRGRSSDSRGDRSSDDRSSGNRSSEGRSSGNRSRSSTERSSGRSSGRRSEPRESEDRGGSADSQGRSSEERSSGRSSARSGRSSGSGSDGEGGRKASRGRRG